MDRVPLAPRSLSSSSNSSESTQLLRDANDRSGDDDSVLAGGAFLPLTAAVTRVAAPTRTAHEDPRRWAALAAYSTAALTAAAVFAGTTALSPAARTAAHRLYAADPGPAGALALGAVLPAAAAAAWLLVRARGTRNAAVHGAAWGLGAALLRALPAVLPSPPHRNAAVSVVAASALVLGNAAAGVALALLAVLPAPLAALWCCARRRAAATALLCAPLVLGHGAVAALLLPIAVHGHFPTGSSSSSDISSSSGSSSSLSSTSEYDDPVGRAAHRYGVLQLCLAGAAAVGLVAALLLPAAPRHAPSVTASRYRSRTRLLTSVRTRASTASRPRPPPPPTSPAPTTDSAGSINAAAGAGAGACSGLITAAGTRARVHAAPRLCGARGALGRYVRAVTAPLRRARSAPVVAGAGLLVGAALTALVLGSVLVCTTNDDATTAAYGAAGTGWALAGLLVAGVSLACCGARGPRGLRAGALGAALPLAAALGTLAVRAGVQTAHGPRWVQARALRDGALALAGGAGGAVLPLALELAAEAAYPSPEGVAAALVLAPAAALVLALYVVAATVRAPACAAAAVGGGAAGAAVVGAALLAAVRPRYGRLEVDEAGHLVDGA